VKPYRSEFVENKTKIGQGELRNHKQQGSRGATEGPKGQKKPGGVLSEGNKESKGVQQVHEKRKKKV